MASSTRTETDSFGPIDVPADAYWGAQTERSIGNFPFGPREAMPSEIVHALGFVKQAAARVNARIGGLDAGLAEAIQQAAGEVAAGDAHRCGTGRGIAPDPGLGNDAPPPRRPGRGLGSDRQDRPYPPSGRD